MNTFFPLLKLGIRRRSRDFFIIFYTVVFPIVIIALLGYLTSTSYGTEFTSYEYYSIVIIPFCLLMGVTSVVYAAADEKRMKTAAGSDAGAYMVPHGKGICQEYESFCQILGNIPRVTEWLKNGEKEIRERFRRK